MRILIIESRSGVGFTISRALTPHPALVTQIVPTLDEQLEQVTAQRFDAIIIDAPLEWTRARIMSLRRAQCQYPILAIGAFEDKSLVVELIERGADDCLDSPWQAEELCSRVIALIRRSRGYATSSIAVGDLTLDINEGQLLRSGIPLDLRPEEYGLVEYLALRRGQRITTREIAAEALESRQMVDDAWVAAIVANISGKIGSDPEPIIEACGSDEYRICC